MARRHTGVVMEVRYRLAAGFGGAASDGAVDVVAPSVDAGRCAAAEAGFSSRLDAVGSPTLATTPPADRGEADDADEMKRMTPDELIANYPALHHMAEPDSWPGIRQLGLLTTAQLVDACNPDSGTRTAILNQRRPRSYKLTHPVVGTVTVRDQKPLQLHNLQLTDVTVEAFLELLNNRVFMWASSERLTRLLGARPYRNSVHDVLVLDTAGMVGAYSDSIRLTGINTGATIFPTAPPRGAESFMTIADFPFTERRRGRRLEDTVVELCVIGGVDNVEDFVIRVERRKGANVIETIYEG